jgi:murein hydrolase activator
VLLPCLIFLMVCQGAVLAAGQDAKARLEEQRRKAEDAKEALKELSEEERRLNKSLAKAEDAMLGLQGRIGKAEQALVEVEEAESRARDNLAKLELRKRQSMLELSKIMQGLWPVQIRRGVLHGRDVPAWDEADREFVWMSRLYEKVERSLALVVQQERAIEETLREQRALADKARQSLADINKDKDTLLRRRMRFKEELALVRESKVDQQQLLQNLLTAIHDLDYKVRHEPEKEQERKPFDKLKGALYWPVRGEVVSGFKPEADPPMRGLGIKLSNEAQVHAVSWGRVVHNDVLRGFGRVIILLHGKDYYSLYAFLATSDVANAQEVSAGEVLGRAGYYPQVKGPGLYFELRFRQKPINPRQWLSAQK